MHTDADFIRTICERPFDDAPRLIYAEWLEDRAHEDGGTGCVPDHRAARAEFIRVQIDLANSQHGRIPKERFETLKNRETELLSKTEIIFVGDMPILWNHIRRGFVSSISCPLAEFMRNAGEIFAKHPVTAVRLTDREPAADYSSGFFWRISSRLEFQDYIPLAIISRSPPDVCRLFPTAGAAHLALSRACVDYGRSLAGLPPIAWPTSEQELAEPSGISG